MMNAALFWVALLMLLVGSAVTILAVLALALL